MHGLRKLVTASVVATTLLGVMSASAFANNLHWRQGGVDIVAGEKVPVATSGAIVVKASPSGFLEARGGCTLNTTGTVENPSGGGSGLAHFTSVTFTSCQKSTCPIASVTASNVGSWLGRLNESASGTERFLIQNMTLVIHYAGTYPCPTETTITTAGGSQESEIISQSPTTFLFGPEAGDTNTLFLTPGNVQLSGRDSITSPAPNGPQWIGTGL
jgi:hypothetical protein